MAILKLLEPYAFGFQLAMTSKCWEKSSIKSVGAVLVKLGHPWVQLYRVLKSPSRVTLTNSCGYTKTFSTIGFWIPLGNKFEMLRKKIQQKCWFRFFVIEPPVSAIFRVMKSPSRVTLKNSCAYTKRFRRIIFWILVDNYSERVRKKFHENC